ncbi:MAG: hypothetical protein GX884_05765 [Chloroflexi bacterium]|nr:hypothetical protein [Chloroflexota bacterium]
MSRKKYINAYETIYEYDDQGRETRKMVYRGNFYEVSLDQKGLSHYRFIQITLFVLIAVIHIALGFLNNPGTRTLYVSIPYTATFIPLVFWGFAVFRLPRKQKLLRLEEVGLSFHRLKSMTLLTIIFTAISLIGMVIYFVFFWKTKQGSDSVFFLGNLIGFGIAVYAWMLNKGLKIKEIVHETE